MPLIRGHHSFDEQYAQIPNSWLRDSRLTLKAIGLLAQIMSHRPGWNMSIRNLAANNKVGRDSISAALKELEFYGYLVRTQERGDNNKWGEAIYTTSDPMPEKPLAEKPLPEKPSSGNHATKNTIQLENQTKENNKKETATKKLSQLDETWQPNEKLLAMFPIKWQLLKPSEDTEAFRLYHRAKGSKFVDWDLAYQQWMNRAQKWAAEKQPAQAERKILGDF
jgi:DNA-binding transcriptional regulator GbsR (MarR family)